MGYDPAYFSIQRRFSTDSYIKTYENMLAQAQAQLAAAQAKGDSTAWAKALSSVRNDESILANLRAGKRAFTYDSFTFREAEALIGVQRAADPITGKIHEVVGVSTPAASWGAAAASTGAPAQMSRGGLGLVLVLGAAAFFLLRRR